MYSGLENFNVVHMMYTRFSFVRRTVDTISEKAGSEVKVGSRFDLINYAKSQRVLIYTNVVGTVIRERSYSFQQPTASYYKLCLGDAIKLNVKLV